MKALIYINGEYKDERTPSDFPLDTFNSKESFKLAVERQAAFEYLQPGVTINVKVISEREQEVQKYMDQGCSKRQAEKLADGWWQDPAGGWHSPNEDDPAAMYK